MPDVSCEIESLGKLHPQIRADDWRSPVVIRLLQDAPYKDGAASITVNCRGNEATEPNDRKLDLSWSGLGADYKKCRNTYQAPDVTEFAALGVACIATACCADVEISEVTQRGDRADYWLNGREFMLEVSGQQRGNLEALRDDKRDQLLNNPYDKPGFVCVSDFEQKKTFLWFYQYRNGECHGS